MKNLVSVIIPCYNAEPFVGEAIERRPPDRAPAVMVRNHGFYTWGEGPAEAHRHVEALAWLYDWSWQQEWARRQP